MAPDKKVSPSNHGTIKGRCVKSSKYTTKAGKKYQRMDIMQPSVDEYSHPVNVSVHTQSLENREGQDVEIHYSVSTFLRKGTGDYAHLTFDETRLEELAPF